MMLHFMQRGFYLYRYSLFRLPVLLAPFHRINAAVRLSEAGARLPEAERHALLAALCAQVEHPVVIAHPRLRPGLAADEHPLNLRAEIGRQADTLEQRLADDLLCRIGSERSAAAARRRGGGSRRCSRASRFRSRRPSRRAVPPKAQNALGDDENESSGRARIIRHAAGRQTSASSRKKSEEKQVNTGSSPAKEELSVPLPAQRLIELGRLDDAAAVAAVQRVRPIHIAVQAALGILAAAMPRVPLQARSLPVKK